jgi:hypothetical protein
MRLSWSYDLIYFWFAFFFYEVISVSWLKLWVNLIDSSFFCIFLNDFFFNFILQHWVDYELGLMIYFCLVSMILSWSYDLIYFWFAFYEVISVSWLKSWVNLIDSSFFCIFLNDFFFNFILQHSVDYELDLIIYFGLLYTRLSWSYDSGHVFRGLTRVDCGHFIVSCFHNDCFFNFNLKHDFIENWPS